jgi:hypothetical protein
MIIYMSLVSPELLFFVFVDAEISSTRFEEFSVSTADTNDVGELKVSFK